MSANFDSHFFSFGSAKIYTTKSLGPVFGWQSDQCTIQSLATTFIKLFAKDIGRFSAANELQKPANG